MIPISIELWNQPKDEELQVSFVEDRQKEDLWKALKVNFTLPEEEDPENRVMEPMIKSFAFKKMADLFRRWKNELKAKFVDKKKDTRVRRDLRSLEINGMHLWPTRHRRGVRRCQR